MTATETQCTITPLGDKVLIKRDEAETMSPGGIALPERSKERPTRGKIVAAGPGCFQHGVFVKSTVHEGQRVLFSAFAGQKVEEDGVEYLMVRNDDVLAVLGSDE